MVHARLLLMASKGSIYSIASAVSIVCTATTIREYLKLFGLQFVPHKCTFSSSFDLDENESSLRIFAQTPSIKLHKALEYGTATTR